MGIAINPFKKGERVRLTQQYMNDDFYLNKGTIGTVVRYDDFLVIVSMPRFVTACLRESVLERVEDTGSRYPHRS